ncbi:MAG: hypothetical protein AMXMBFR78_21190 [Rubrivivax sp.]
MIAHGVAVAVVDGLEAVGVDEHQAKRAILCGGSGPSGANQQPWHFAVIESPALKKRMREEAEEEQTVYNGRAPTAADCANRKKMLKDISSWL